MKKAKAARVVTANITDPPIYDPGLAVTPAGVCLCCLINLKIAPHQYGCPIKVVETLKYRVTHNGDRYTPKTSVDSVNPRPALVNLLGMLDEDGHLDGLLEQYEGEDEDAWESAFQVEIVGSTDVEVTPLVPHAIEARRAEREEEQRQQAIRRLGPERAGLLRELEANRSLYSTKGYQTMRDRILKDPKYKDLPEV